MTKIIWDAPSYRLYEVGVDRGVFYPSVGPGIPWNGLVSIGELESETSSGKIIYVDGNKHTTELGLGTFAAIITAVTYPEEFEEYDGTSELGVSNQRRKPFNFSYRSKIGNDVKGQDAGYLIHLVYNALATPSNKDYSSVGNSLSAYNFSWGISTTPVFIPDSRATSHFIIDSRTVIKETLYTIEELLYGTSVNDPKMPTITEVLDIFETNAVFKVKDLGNGLYSISGPDSAVHEISPNLWEIDWVSVNEISEHLYKISSY